MNERMESSLGLENVENKEVAEWEFVEQHVAIDVDPVQPSVVGYVYFMREALGIWFSIYLKFEFRML